MIEPFTQDNGLLTPTMKLKRNFAKTHYAELIKQLYEMPPMKVKRAKM